MEKLPTLVRGYAPENIWNLDETACFFPALPERTLADAKTDCKGKKKAKQCITLVFMVNDGGGKELPIVIGRATSPRCFKGIRDKGVPYSWCPVLLVSLTVPNVKPGWTQRSCWMFSTRPISSLYDRTGR